MAGTSSLVVHVSERKEGLGNPQLVRPKNFLGARVSRPEVLAEAVQCGWHSNVYRGGGELEVLNGTGPTIYVARQCKNIG